MIEGLQTIYIYFLIIGYLLDLFVIPFYFGKEKIEKEYNAKEWLFKTIFYIPLIYILIINLL